MNPQDIENNAHPIYIKIENINNIELANQEVLDNDNTIIPHIVDENKENMKSSERKIINENVNIEELDAQLDVEKSSSKNMTKVEDC